MVDALYIYPSDPASDAAVRMARDVKDVEIIDISKEAELPAYVNGVPLLADEKTEYRGTECLNRLKELKELSPTVKAIGAPDEEASNFVGDLGFKSDVSMDPKKDLNNYMKERSALLQVQDPRRQRRSAHK